MTTCWHIPYEPWSDERSAAASGSDAAVATKSTVTASTALAPRAPTNRPPPSQNTIAHIVNGSNFTNKVAAAARIVDALNFVPGKAAPREANGAVGQGADTLNPTDKAATTALVADARNFTDKDAPSKTALKHMNEVAGGGSRDTANLE